MNHAMKAIQKAGLENVPRGTIITPNDPDSDLFTIDHDRETQAAMDLQDKRDDTYKLTVNSITPEVLTSFKSQSRNLSPSQRRTLRRTAQSITPEVRRSLHEVAK